MNETLKKELERIDQLPIEDKVKEINELKKGIKKISPFVKEPVDCVIWVKSDEVVANEYNPKDRKSTRLNSSHPK